MNAARPVPNSPPTALTTGLRRISRSIVSTTARPTDDGGRGVQPGERIDADEGDRPQARVDERAPVAQQVQRARRVLGRAHPGLRAASMRL